MYILYIIAARAMRSYSAVAVPDAALSLVLIQWCCCLSYSVVAVSRIVVFPLMNPESCLEEQSANLGLRMNTDTREYLLSFPFPKMKLSTR